MKRLPLLLLLVFFTTQIYAQINFREGSLEQMKQLAQSSDKGIFIDFFTSWCGPCKMMSTEVFTQESVGEYFNTKFICCKWDAEAKENIAVAKSFNVNAFPCMLFLDKDGKELRRVVGFVVPEVLINNAMVAIGDKKSFEAIYAEYRKNKKDFSLQQSLLLDGPLFIQGLTDYERTKWVARIETLFPDYVSNKGLDKMINPSDFKILSIYNQEIKKDDAIFNHIVKHYDEYIKVCNQQEVASYIVSLYNGQIIRYCKKGNSEYKNLLNRLDGDLGKIYSQIKFGNVPVKEAVTLLSDATYNLYKMKDDLFFDNMNKYFVSMGKELSLDDYTQPIEDIFTLYNGKLSEASFAKVLTWIGEALKFDMDVQLRCRLLIMMGESFKGIGNKEKAKQSYNQAYLTGSEIANPEMRKQLQNMIRELSGEL